MCRGPRVPRSCGIGAVSNLRTPRSTGQRPRPSSPRGHRRPARPLDWASGHDRLWSRLPAISEPSAAPHCSGADHSGPAALQVRYVQPLAARKPGQIEAIAERPVTAHGPRPCTNKPGTPVVPDVVATKHRPRYSIDPARISDQRLHACPGHRQVGHPFAERGHQLRLGHRRQPAQHHSAGRKTAVHPTVVARRRPRIPPQSNQTGLRPPQYPRAAWRRRCQRTSASRVTNE